MSLTASEYLAFLYPASSTLPASQVATALTIAADYAPVCLIEAKQAEAVALYAAFLLEDVTKRADGVSTASPAGPLIREKEGQLERQYADGSATGEGYVDNSFYGRWKRLNDLCAVGAIVTRFG
ncbi:hypothetical protein POR1_8 [Pseudomonas phage POR1]|uniref:DUF4054 domain-containing protein n=1 Tax=Pseudomonas phage POR1 TaxID=1718594 RepID=A0A0N9SJE5_9CAUD|nr:hypothetical protein POR1_8 [Pseudomonas phage POR1]